MTKPATYYQRMAIEACDLHEPYGYSGVKQARKVLSALEGRAKKWLLTDIVSKFDQDAVNMSHDGYAWAEYGIPSLLYLSTQYFQGWKRMMHELGYVVYVECGASDADGVFHYLVISWGGGDNYQDTVDRIEHDRRLACGG